MADLRVVFDPVARCYVEVEVIYAGGPLPWQRTVQPDYRARGTLDAYAGGLPEETETSVRRCVSCGKPLVPHPGEDAAHFTKRIGCSRACSQRNRYARETAAGMA